VLEVVSGKAKTIVACMYFDITRQIEDDLNKIEAIVDYAKGLSSRFRMPRPP
jgi:conjugal transfer/entry exclusion protein